MKQTNTFILSSLLVIFLASYKTNASVQEDNEFLDAHNKARRRAGMPPFTYDQTLAKYARKYALSHANDCALRHSNGPYGENLFWGSADGSRLKWTPKDAVYAWIREHKYYDKKTKSCIPGKKCGHYTQIMWRDTKKVGCALSYCNNKSTYVACEYDPPGNFEGLSPFERHDPFIYGKT
ncbi:pathogenesis-related protein 1A-like [Cynara cardunculus var. scolymus]|uniref:SCP domain-containing protein n=1 Tax=Cynara cardunculus var. scolymus TaxID=59895 RepID=A0A118JTJ9_CYNCS|nr:pathogenesis-related protein 1A-like [Cynara cardunculus var. scolymus]KVH91057.1 hypothetical protein Ccrd_006928 [Cynara cardunculus var. scolymus]